MRLAPAAAVAFCGILSVLAAPAPGQASADAELKPLFNGRDLSGWVPVNVAPSTFTVRDGIIVSTGVPTGVMRTDRMYENFVLELEWKHIKPGGNAGLFAWSDALTSVGVPFTRAIEIQVLDGLESEDYTSHGDVFSIHGATMKPDRPHPHGWMRCLPSEKRAKPAGQWNHYRLECNDGSIKLAVNGKVVSGASKCHPRKGYICLESEGGECHFRNIRIKELPSTGAKGDDVAKADEEFKSIYTGVDLSGWKADDAAKEHWKPKDWTLVYDGKGGDAEPLWTQREYGDFEMIADWRITDRNAPAGAGPKVCFRGEHTAAVPIGGAGGAAAAARKAGDWNRLVVKVKGRVVTATLNDQTVMEKAQATGMPARGPVGLIGGASPVEFANLYVREPR